MTAPAQRNAVSYWREQDAMRRQQAASDRQESQITIPGASGANANYQQRQQELDAAGPRSVAAQMAANAQLRQYQTQYQYEKQAYDDWKTGQATAAAQKAEREARDAAFDAWVKNQPKGPVYNPGDFWVEKGSDGGWVVIPKAGGQTPPPASAGPEAPVQGRGSAGGVASGTGQGVIYDNAQYNQVADWARQAGWDEGPIDMLLGIAMAESTMNPAAINNRNPNGSVDRGLMQINSVHTDLAAKYDLMDPVQNLMAAKELYDRKGNFTDWVTFNSGDYAKYTGSHAPGHLGQVKVYTAPYDGGPQLVQTTTGMRNAVITNAKKYIGLAYVWGGENLQTGVDCSGFVNEIYETVGIDFARTADELSRTVIGYSSPINKLRPGDLVAWQGGQAYGPDYRGHIAIWMGDGKIIEATGDHVQIGTIRPDESVLGIALYLPGDKTRPTGIAAGSVPRPSGKIPGSTPVKITPWNGTSYTPPGATPPSGGGGIYYPPPAPPVSSGGGGGGKPPPKAPAPKPKPKPKPRRSVRGSTSGSKAV